MDMNNQWKISVILVLVLMPTVPQASAHICSSYEGCDATACKDGEAHDHTDQNYWPQRDNHCASSANPPEPQPGSCEYFGERFPPAVCRLLEIAEARALAL